MTSKEDLLSQIESLKLELNEQKRLLPAHSIRPHQLLAIEELEEEIEKLEEKLQILDK
ncbi:MAG TPA: histidine kinase [Desulfobacteraceae bacterium]|nr:histidine kinase [Desulfobacteraceae bacterium]